MVKTQKGIVGGYNLNGALVRIKDTASFFQQDLGKCCCCTIEPGHQIVLVPVVLPQHLHGTGWCCYICQSEFNNAVAVLCDGCAKLFAAMGPRIVQYFLEGEAPTHERLHVTDVAAYNADGTLEPLVHSRKYHMEAVGGQLGNGEIFFGLS